MNSKLFLFVCSALYLLPSLLWAERPAVSDHQLDAAVCFWDFRAESPVGKSEMDIDRPYYCRYTVDRVASLKLLSPRPAAEFYMPGYVRAKITLSPGDVYFVDNRGVVRHGDQRFAADKDQFSAALKELRKGDQAPKGKRCNTECGKSSDQAKRTTRPAWPNKRGSSVCGISIGLLLAS